MSPGRDRIIVQKFGGTSVASPARIMRAAGRIVRYHRLKYRVVVIVSALGQRTDELIELARQITRKPPGREMDMLLSTGEQASSALLAMALQERGVDAISLLGFQIGINTDSLFTRARILGIRKGRMFRELKKGRVVIVAGFQGVDARQEITTLGRGGSDLTAVAIARVLGADACEIYTDVDGIFTTDPRIVPSAKMIPRISYEEMLELASSGAQVMQARSIELAGKHGVQIHVRSSLKSQEGTWIVEGDEKMEQVLVRGVTLTTDEAKLIVTNVPNRPGMAARIFRALARRGINVDMIIQNIREKEKMTDISFTVPLGDVDETRGAIRVLLPQMPQSRLLVDTTIAKVSVVGIGMRSHSGVAADMFEVLGKNRINIEMISTSEIKISCVVHKNQGRRAVEVLHRHFKLHRGEYRVVGR